MSPCRGWSLDGIWSELICLFSDCRSLVSACSMTRSSARSLCLPIFVQSRKVSAICPEISACSFLALAIPDWLEICSIVLLEGSCSSIWSFGFGCCSGSPNLCWCKHVILRGLVVSTWIPSTRPVLVDGLMEFLQCCCGWLLLSACYRASVVPSGCC